jgi:hypothetical protein
VLPPSCGKAAPPTLGWTILVRGARSSKCGKQQLDVTHARLSEKEQSVPEVLLSQVRLFAQSDMDDARQLAILQYKVVWASYSEEDRQNYCRAIEEITGQSQAELEASR